MPGIGPVVPAPDLPRPQVGAAPEELQQVARQFEAMLLEQLFRQMRTAAEAIGGQPKGAAHAIHAGWFDQEVARSIARAGGLGLADALQRQLIARYGR